MGKKTPVLHTERLILRPFKKEDTHDAFYGWENDEDVARYMLWTSHSDIDKTKEWIDFELSKINDDKWFRFALVTKENNDLIGTGIVYYEEEVSGWEIGYNLSKKFWKTGYTTEAMKRIIQFAREELKLTEIIGRYAIVNSASGNVMKKLGFRIVKDIDYYCNDGKNMYPGIMCKLSLAQEENLEISHIKRNDMDEALKLVWSVFLAYEGKDYNDEGINTFKESVIDNDEYLNNIDMYGARINDRLVGVIATRSNGNHIALFFVDGNFQGRGIGRKLFNVIAKDNMTVNSSPYGVKIYESLGFVKTNDEQTSDGVRYIPMIFKGYNNEIQELRKLWKEEEKIAHIHGWDFSHIDNRSVSEENNMPWDLKELILKYIKKENKLLDIDTGGGEFLLSMNHPYENTSATEGYEPNVKLCSEKLTPLGIDFHEMSEYNKMPFEDNSFDIIMDRHGDYDVNELHRVLRKDGLFITQQVGEDNDRAFVELLIDEAKKPFEGFNLKNQVKIFEDAGFTILEQGECFKPMRFYDVGALVWFARIIQWEFIDFSVDKCFDNLLKCEEIIREKGYIEGFVHRFMIVAKK